MAPLRIGIVDSGVNPWHSHAGGRIAGCRIHVAADGRIVEDDDYRDLIGHGTAVAGVIREAFPDALIFAVRVFDAGGTTYPSVVARGMLRAAAAQCAYVNLSIAVAPGPGAEVLAAACAAVIDAGGVVVASARPEEPHLLPASLPGVHAVTADDTLAFAEVVEDAPFRLRACGRPRDLDRVPRETNLRGHSFACARALVHLARLGRARA
jgi:subtilisin family serine protease